MSPSSESSEFQARSEAALKFLDERDLSSGKVFSATDWSQLRGR